MLNRCTMFEIASRPTPIRLYFAINLAPSRQYCISDEYALTERLEDWVHLYK
jgi:hypothetical protein